MEENNIQNNVENNSESNNALQQQREAAERSLSKKIKYVRWGLNILWVVIVALTALVLWLFFDFDFKRKHLMWTKWAVIGGFVVINLGVGVIESVMKARLP